MIPFSPGDILCIKENGMYQCFKVLQVSGELLVRSYWPESLPPVSWHANELSIQRTCDELAEERIEHAQKIGNEPISAQDEEEISNYQRIKRGLAQRKELLEELLQKANALFARENWEEAMHLYTEATSFARNNREIFEKRGACYLKLGREGEAKADLDHAANLRNQ